MEVVAKPGRAGAPRPPRTARGAVPTECALGFATGSRANTDEIREMHFMYSPSPYSARFTLKNRRFGDSGVPIKISALASPSTTSAK